MRIRLQKSLHEKVKNQADRDSVPMAVVIRYCIDELPLGSIKQEAVVDTSVRLTDEQVMKLDSFAAETGVTRTTALQMVLGRFLDEESLL